jgi:hypothetical protein
MPELFYCALALVTLRVYSYLSVVFYFVAKCDGAELAAENVRLPHSETSVKLPS